LAVANHPTKLRQMIFHVGLGWLDQRFVPQTLIASGSFAGLVFSHPILTDVETQKVHSGLIAFQGVADARFVWVQRQSDSGQPLT
jgi:hypothetical protein